jgi:uncharacterized membrane protein YoaK (UPF0700 family)
MTARTSLLLLGLTLVAGSTDAIAFFGLGVFTTNMTGNTVLLGAALASRVIPAFPGEIGLTLPAISIGAWIAGVALAAVFLRTSSSAWRQRLLLLIVALCLGGVAGAAAAFGTLDRLAVLVLSIAMGMQSVVALRSGGLGVSTTYVTGTLVTGVVALIGAPPHGRNVAGARVNMAVWGVYLLGTLAGAFALHRFGVPALAIDAVVVALLGAVL